MTILVVKPNGLTLQLVSPGWSTSTRTGSSPSRLPSSTGSGRSSSSTARRTTTSTRSRSTPRAASPPVPYSARSSVAWCRSSRRHSSTPSGTGGGSLSSGCWASCWRRRRCCFTSTGSASGSGLHWNCDVVCLAGNEWCQPYLTKPAYVVYARRGDYIIKTRLKSMILHSKWELMESLST